MKIAESKCNTLVKEDVENNEILSFRAQEIKYAAPQSAQLTTRSSKHKEMHRVVQGRLLRRSLLSLHVFQVCDLGKTHHNLWKPKTAGPRTAVFIGRTTWQRFQNASDSKHVWGILRASTRCAKRGHFRKWKNEIHHTRARNLLLLS